MRVTRSSGGVETGGSGGSMARGPRSPGGAEWGHKNLGKNVRNDALAQYTHGFQ